MIQSIECQKGIFSEEDKSFLVNAFKEEKTNLISKSTEVKKSLNMDSLMEAFKNGKEK